jgi:hypothetical protein
MTSEELKIAAQTRIVEIDAALLGRQEVEVDIPADAIPSDAVVEQILKISKDFLDKKRIHRRLYRMRELLSRYASA